MDGENAVAGAWEVAVVTADTAMNACPMRDTEGTVEVPSVCAYQSVLLGVPQGIVLLRMTGPDILLINPNARSYLRDMGVVETTDAIRARFLGGDRTGAPIVELGEVRSITRVYRFANYFLDRSHLLFIEDVTDRKRYESIAANADMANNTALLVSSLRHELGNPVNSLKMALSVLGENMEEFDEERRHRYVERCLQQVRALEELLGHLRSFHAMDVFTPQIERLDTFFNEHCEFLRGVVKGCGVELRVVPCITPVTVLAHRRALQQALSNITTNAIEAMEGQPDACLELEVVEDAGYVFIEVSDNGPGIDSNSRREVFTPLFSTKEHGTGLGLAIVRNLMTGMKGDVELESELGLGTTVRLVLQRAEPVQTEQRSAALPRVLAPL